MHATAPLFFAAGGSWCWPLVAAARALVAGGLMLTALASPARAGLDLSWRSCGAEGDSAAFLDCANPDSVLVLHGRFQVPDTLRDIAAMTVFLDVVIESDRIPGYWRMEPGGCNRAGIGFSKEPPEDACPDVVGPWTAGNSVSGIGSQGRQPDSSVTRIQLMGAIAQSMDAPITLVPGVDYYGFQIRLFTDKAREAGDECDGCGIPVAIRWTGLRFERAPWLGAPHVFDFSGPGRGSDRVGLNGPSRASMDVLRALAPPAPPVSGGSTK